MNKVLIIGLGGIGFRHFQSLLHGDNLDIEIVDTNPEAIKRALDYFYTIASETNCNVRVKMNSEIKGEKIDIAIIATSSGPRRGIIEDLIDRNQIQFLILEKFLFQRVSDFDDINLLINQKGLDVYVNCPRRYYPQYEEIKNLISGAKYYNIDIDGADWGLACNSIHYLDLIQFITGCDEKDEMTCEAFLDNKILQSKRNGYIEFSGKLTGTIGSNVVYSLRSSSCGTTSVIIKIQTEKYNIEISEVNKHCLIKDSYGNTINDGQFEILFQSNLTSLYVKDLLSCHKCKLPSYSLSSISHKTILKSIIKHYNYLCDKEDDWCPIT